MPLFTPNDFINTKRSIFFYKTIILRHRYYDLTVEQLSLVFLTDQEKDN